LDRDMPSAARSTPHRTPRRSDAVGCTSESARARALEARARLPAVVSLLREGGARCVILFGSLTTGAIDDESDVDLALEGLSGADTSELGERAERIMGRRVQLTRLDRAPPWWRAIIEHTGERMA
jgi:predicted nucleotidyltransferase